MARLARFFVPDIPLHVIQRGNNREAMFHERADRYRYLLLLGEYVSRCEVAIHAYILMPNHVHLLVSPVKRSSVPRLMQRVGSRYVAWYNHRHSRTGTLCEGRYRAAIVDHDRYLLSCMRYIELNAVRAGIVADPAEYPWSSYHCNALGAHDELIHPHATYRALGWSSDARRDAYRDLVHASLPEETLRLIREATQFEWALGDEAFRAAVEGAGRRASPRPGGRPRKSSADPQKTSL
jgi:putative transposase